MLISDGGSHLVSEKVKQILRQLIIKDWQSEPYHQNQNFAERRYRDFKARVKLIMDATRATAEEWLLVFLYIAHILNRTAVKSIGNKTPYEKLTGEVPDVSEILAMPYRQLVSYTEKDESYPQKSNERIGFFVGFNENVGHQMTFRVLDIKTGMIKNRSRIRTLEGVPNMRAIQPETEEEIENIKRFLPRAVNDDNVQRQLKNIMEGKHLDHDAPIKSEVLRDLDRGETAGWKHFDLESIPNDTMDTIDTSKLIGRSYLKPTDDNEERVRAVIKDCVKEHNGDVRLIVTDTMCDEGETYEEKIAYGQVIDFVNEKFGEESNMGWRFRNIKKHKDMRKDPRFKSDF